ncbi:hypothetical protein ON010_g10427 [Phytophthora cinnamomi]|nr:hypothetical protein ON010_g10427 [Phytophthora cinnamomi]
MQLRSHEANNSPPPPHSGDRGAPRLMHACTGTPGRVPSVSSGFIKPAVNDDALKTIKLGKPTVDFHSRHKVLHVTST